MCIRDRLYDLGFASIKAEKTDQAYQYWNQLYQLEIGYKKVQRLITVLRKEMDADSKQASDFHEESVDDYYKDWLEDVFPEYFVWEICGLKSDKEIDLRNVVVTARVSDGRSEKEPAAVSAMGTDASERIKNFLELDIENFRIISNRLVAKLGYRVNDILETYRESDGVDFMASDLTTKESVLVSVRRWSGVQVGEIPLRNFAQDINDKKAKKGLFITTSDLTGSAQAAIPRLSKVTIVDPEQVGSLLKGLV